MFNVVNLIATALIILILLAVVREYVLSFFYVGKRGRIARLKETIKVFRLNDYEWWAGRSFEEIRDAYLKETGLRWGDAFEEPRLLSEDMLLKLTYIDDGVKRTFREQLDLDIERGQKYPSFFAGTEF